jgi:hypothetical protein
MQPRAPDWSHCDPGFRPLVSDFLEPMLLGSAVVSACGLWPDMRLAYLSSGWFHFAASNEGEPAISSRWNVGANILSGTSGPLRPFFEARYKQCLAEGRPWEHLYECSSPTRYRLFQMLCYPLDGGAGLLCIHSKRVETAWEPGQVAAPDLQCYIDAAGIYHQCSYCRRMRRAAEPEVWDRVTAWIGKPPESTSHGICEACLGYYLPRLAVGNAFEEFLRTSQES